MKHDKRTITAMVTGMAIGAALVSEAAAGIVAEPTWQKIYVDGRQVSMTAYNIAGSNYVKLRDIGQQVGFNVYWEDGVQIDTDAPYTGVAPVQGISSQPTIMEIREEMIRCINEVRRKYDVPELAVNEALMDAAQEYSSYLYTKHNNRVECETVLESGVLPRLRFQPDGVHHHGARKDSAKGCGKLGELPWPPGNDDRPKLR